MGIGRGFARHRAQAKALRFVKAGGLQFSVVEGEPLRFALFDKQLAVIGALQGLCKRSVACAWLVSLLSKSESGNGNILIQ